MAKRTKEQDEALEMARFFVSRVGVSGVNSVTRRFTRLEWAKTFAGRCYFVRRELGLANLVKVTCLNNEVHITRRQP